MPVVGLTLDELVDRTGCDRRPLKLALADEVDRGRVLALEDGRYQLRPGSLPPEVTRALRALARPDVAWLANGSRRRPPAGGPLSAVERGNLYPVTG
jgi:hypothetical protein